VEQELIIRDKNRILGGVCFAIGKKYKVEPWILRIVLIISSYFFYLPILAYLIIWIIIPNSKNISKKTIIKNQILGTFIGGILGSIILGGIVYIDVNYANYDASGAIGVVFTCILGFLIGMLVGFIISRVLSERKS
jgi:phage shock protein PspC (stress-responsive transcriptional regulator)